jgi:hypothetical protein
MSSPKVGDKSTMALGIVNSGSGAGGGAQEQQTSMKQSHIERLSLIMIPPTFPI